MPLTIEQMSKIADAVEINTDVALALREALIEAETALAADDKARQVTHEWLNRGYTF